MSWQNSPSELFERLSPLAIVLSKFPQVKHTFQLLGCAFFFSWTVLPPWKDWRGILRSLPQLSSPWLIALGDEEGNTCGYQIIHSYYPMQTSNYPFKGYLFPSDSFLLALAPSKLLGGYNPTAFSCPVSGHGLTKRKTLISTKELIGSRVAG